MSQSNLRNIYIGMLTLTILTLVGCGSGTSANLPEPAGAPSSKNTFILFYTDN